MRIWISIISLVALSCVTKHIAQRLEARNEQTQPAPIDMSSEAFKCESLNENVPAEYTASRMLTFGDCLFAKGDLQGALDSYNRVYELYKLTSTEIRIEALLQKSKVLERKSLWQDSVIALREAEPLINDSGSIEEKMGIYLRIGYLYTYLGQTETAYMYIEKAEKLFNEIPISTTRTQAIAKVAEFYNDYLIPEDFDSAMEVFGYIQKYMAHVLYNGDEKERQEILRRYQDAEKNFYQMTQQEERIKTTFNLEDKFEVKAIQRDWLQKIAESVQDTKNLLSDEKSNKEVETLIALLKDLGKKVNDDIYNIRRQTPLTPESSRLHSIKHNERITPTVLLPEEH